VEFFCSAKSHPTEITIPQVQCSSVVQPSLIPQKSIYRKLSAALMYSQVSSHSSHYTASSVQLSCTAKSHSTAVTIPQVHCSSVVQPNLIPKQSLYRKFSAALLYRQVSSYSGNYTASSVQLSCKAMSHLTADTILPVQCSTVLQPSLFPQQSLCGKFSAAVLDRQDLYHSSHYTVSSVQLCCTANFSFHSSHYTAS